MTGVALVTGGSGALGGAVARRLSAAGYAVAVHYSTDKAGAQDVQASLADPYRSTTVRADVSQWEDVKAMVDEVEQGLGPVDVLVNSGAIRKDGLMATQPVEEWHDTIATNLIGTFHCCRATVPGMLRRRGGRIINVVSPAGLMGSRGQTAYSASKAGVIGLTRSLALECGKRGVTVNALSPGFMETRLTEGVPPEVSEQFLARAALKRFGDPDEIAAGVDFIVGSAYLTGQVISIDGGLSIS
jgi:3-oxoacyl-[acyl-carrier protein] reductase